MTNKQKFTYVVNKLEQWDQRNLLGFAVSDDKYFLGYDKSMNEIYVIETSESGRIRDFDSDGEDIDDLIEFLGARFPKVFEGVIND